MRTLLLTLALTLTSALALAQGTYTQIDYPGSLQTSVNSINSAGEMVGYYEDSESIIHGFLLSGGIYTTIDYPGATAYSDLVGINDSGQVVGCYGDSISGAYLYDRTTQATTNIYVPGSTQTCATGVNNSGIVTGWVMDGTSMYGFKRGPTGHFSKVTIPGYATASLGPMNNLGKGIAYGTNSGVGTYLLLRSGEYRALPIDATKITLAGLNDAGAVVGGYKTGNPVEAGFIRQEGMFQFLVFPDAGVTVAEGINNSGVVVGYFLHDFNLHGFLWTPDPAPQKGH